MKRIGNLSLTVVMIMLLLTIPSIVYAESNTKWKEWTPKAEVDIDKEWVIEFNDEVDWRSLYGGHISVVRQGDNVPMFIEPTTLINDEKSVVLFFTWMVLQNV